MEVIHSSKSPVCPLKTVRLLMPVGVQNPLSKIRLRAAPHKETGQILTCFLS
jgi:hypothetical protein